MEWFEDPGKYPKALKDARVRAGLTQEKLAERAGLKRSVVADIEAGRRRFTEEVREPILKVLLSLEPTNALADYMKPRAGVSESQYQDMRDRMFALQRWAENADQLSDMYRMRSRELEYLLVGFRSTVDQLLQAIATVPDLPVFVDGRQLDENTALKINEVSRLVGAIRITGNALNEKLKSVETAAADRLNKSAEEEGDK
jgi:transcriptional regulator with XRE-family HTH domain